MNIKSEYKIYIHFLSAYKFFSNLLYSLQFFQGSIESVCKFGLLLLFSLFRRQNQINFPTSRFFFCPSVFFRFLTPLLKATCQGLFYWQVPGKSQLFQQRRAPQKLYKKTHLINLFAKCLEPIITCSFQWCEQVLQILQRYELIGCWKCVK